MNKIISLGCLFGGIVLVYCLVHTFNEIRDYKLCVINMEQAGIVYEEAEEACKK